MDVVILVPATEPADREHDRSELSAQVLELDREPGYRLVVVATSERYLANPDVPAFTDKLFELELPARRTGMTTGAMRVVGTFLEVFMRASFPSP